MLTPIIDAIEAGLGKLHECMIGLFAVALALITILIPLNLLLARMQWGSIWWLHESIEYALYIGVFLAAPWVLRRGAHIKADVISANLPEGPARILDRMINLAGAGISAALCVYAVRSGIWEFQDYTYPPKDLRIANWYMMAVFATSFFLLTIEFLLALRRPVIKRPDEPLDLEKLGA